jgi:hypothetical protein
MAFLWIFTALTSAFFYSRENIYNLLNQTHIPSYWQPVLYGACLLNLLIGLALLFNYQIRKLCILQITIIFTYTIIISWQLLFFGYNLLGPSLRIFLYY